MAASHILGMDVCRRWVRQAHVFGQDAINPVNKTFSYVNKISFKSKIAIGISRNVLGNQFSVIIKSHFPKTMLNT